MFRGRYGIGDDQLGDRGEEGEGSVVRRNVGGLSGPVFGAFIRRVGTLTVNSSIRSVSGTGTNESMAGGYVLDLCMKSWPNRSRVTFAHICSISDCTMLCPFRCLRLEASSVCC